jgi:hypothetical protein
MFDSGQRESIKEKCIEKGEALVIKVDNKKVYKKRPLPLNTIEA